MRRRGVSPIRAVILGLSAGIIQLSAAALAVAQSADTNDKPDKTVVERIVECLTGGGEAVLLSNAVECKEYRDGADFLKKQDPGMPLTLDEDQVCAESNDKAKDWRKLSGSAIKAIAAQQKPASPLGIRILGAVFCETVDLIGLDLPHSLVIDRSLFRRGVDARNFRTRGDVSFDGSVASGTITISRARVEGTIFGSDASIKRLQILDSEINGSLIFRRTLISEPAIFDTIALKGELSVRQSMLSYFFVQFSKIGAVLDLTGSQARCAYLIRKSEIGDLVAVDAGFGTSEQSTGQNAAQRSVFDWRIGPKSADSVKAAAAILNSGKDAGQRECRYATIALPGAFLLSDTQVRSSVCLRSFQWLVPRRGGQPRSFVTLNDVNVGATTFIDLGSDRAADPNENLATGKRKFEAVGIKTISLIFNFDAGVRIDETAVGGLSFAQVYAAEVQCSYEPPSSFSPEAGGRERRLETISDPRSQLRSPKVKEVMSWLDHNCLDTTQPLSAFIDAAQRAGEDESAKQLRIEKATKDFGVRFQRVFGIKRSQACDGAARGAAADVSPIASFSGFISFASDVAALVFGSLLWFLADHGYRPEKVGWFVGIALIVSAIYFWLWRGVVGFMSAKKTTLRPIGIVFLFDRLLPVYRIREDHYDIKTFYKRVSHSSSPKGDEPTQPCCGFIHYLGFKIAVVEADEKDTQSAEVYLDVLKVIGLVLAIFLVAAINAMVRH